MQNPSDGVAAQLLPYIHLTSTQRFPQLGQLTEDQAVDYLLQAPRIVRDMAPMVWQIINPPPDGTLFLTWQPPNLRKHMASDGYVWADPENTFHFERHGFTVEMLVHRSGFQPGREQVACHQRKRYHILSKLPSNPQEIDPNLWITHYSPAEPQFRYPAAQIPHKPEYAQMIRDRQYLQERGQLIRKEFMLHDRTNWPNIPFPGGPPLGQQQPGMPMQQPPTPGYPPGHPLVRGPQQMQQPGFYPPQQPAPSATGPQAKRQRVNPPARMPAGPAAPLPSAMELAIEDEENTAVGDYLDHLTPREISTMRYKQHHEWMEEIFSSNYSTGQIVPESLGLGLAGDLAVLTAGILDSPEIMEAAQDRPLTAVGLNGVIPLSKGASVSTQPYKPLDIAQRTEFDKRIDDFTARGEEELKAMKAGHVKRLAGFGRARQYAIAERALRDIRTKDSKTYVGAVTEIQQWTGLTFSQRRDVVPISRNNGAVKASDDHEQENIDALFAKYEAKTKARRAGVNTATPAPLATVPANAVDMTYGSSNNGFSNGNGNGHDLMMPEDSASALLNQYVAGGNSSSGTPGSFNGFPSRSMPQSNAGTPNNMLSAGTPTTGAQQQGTPSAVASAVPTPLQDQGDMQSTLAQGPHVPADLGVGEGMDIDVPSVALAENPPAMLGDAPKEPAQASSAQTAGPAVAQAPDASITTTAIPDSAPPAPIAESMEQPSTTTDAQPQDLPQDLNADINLDIEEPTSMFGEADLSGMNSAGDVLADLGGGDDLDVMAGMVGDGEEQGDLELDLGGLDDSNVVDTFGGSAGAGDQAA